MSGEAWSNGPVTLYTGHVLEVLRGLPAESVQCVVTSPPYWGLRDYGLTPVTWNAAPGCEHEWGEGQAPATKLGLAGNTNGFYADGVFDPGKVHATASKPEAGVTCLRCGAWRGSLGLEPTPQLYVQHLVAVFREVRRVLRSDGVCFLNLGDTRTTTREWAGLPHRVLFALQEDGWRYEDEIVWNKPNAMPGSQTNRTTRAHEMVFVLNKSREAYWDQEAVREGLAESTLADGRNGTGRHTYQESKYEDSNLQGAEKPSWCRAKTFVNPMQGRNLRSVWAIATQPFAGAHFATFPEALVERCILAGTSERGCCPECGAPWERVVERKTMVIARSGRAEASGNRTMPAGTMVSPPESMTVGWRAACAHGELAPVPCTVLDPFSGAGTVALVAQKLGRRAIGVDLSSQYTALAVRRLEEVALPLGSG